MRGIFILLWCVVFLPLTGINIRGKVVDEDGKPIERVRVSDNFISVLSRKDGAFSVNTQGDSLFFSRIGFELKSISIKVLTDKVVLVRRPHALPKVLVSGNAIEIFSSSGDLVSIPIDPDRHYYSASQMILEGSGMHSADIQLRGERQTLSILGNLSRHSLIMLDGVPLNPLGQAFDLSMLDPANIESITFIKNNASVYGGGSAIGGIVQITSKKAVLAHKQDFSSSIELGSYGYAKTVFSVGLASPLASFRLQVSKFNADNDFQYKLPPWWAPDSIVIRENNAKRQSSISTSAVTRYKDLILSYSGDYDSFHRQLPGNTNFTEIYRHAFLEGWSNRNKLMLSARPLGLNLQNMIWFSADNTVYNNTRAPLPVFFSHYRQRTRNLGLRGNLSYEKGMMQGGLAAEVGSQSYENRNLLNPSGNIASQSDFANASIKSQAKREFGIYELLASGALRYDYTKREDHLTGRAELVLSRFGWMQSRLGGTFGTSFALPSPYDLYWKGDSQAIGNPDLVSESSQGWQIWLEMMPPMSILKLAYNDNRIDQLIQWRQVQMNGNAWKPMNIGSARIANFDLSGEFKPFDWLKLNTNALFTKAKDISTLAFADAPNLMYTPQSVFSAGAELKYKNIVFRAKHSFSGKRWTTPDNLLDPLPAYDLTEAGISTGFKYAGWRISPQLNIYNLLNKEYSVYPYVPQPGIAFYAGILVRSGE
ncbi:MAG: TonB-dependent receptor plug domain-containing protein [Candidatus Cloacimonadaceae bacterium]|nr:TonB-dependent receptor plug domain-containing protein [Candidatus Cloacimonadaceae bacterium]